MTLRINPGLQISDLLVYVLLPVAAFLMPAAVSRRLVSRVASWNWVLRSEADASLTHASKYTRIDDEQEWKRRWRTVVLLDARDLYLLTWGRSEAVLSEISGRERIVEARDRVIVGMHWGPGIAILKLLESEGMSPLLVYRKVERDIRAIRPFYYAFLSKAIRYIEQHCGARAIPVRGASDALRQKLPMPGTSIVVLDAPPTPGRSTIEGEVLGWPVGFNAGFPDILKESGREHHLFAISLQPGPGALKILELTDPRPAGSAGELIREYCAFLEQHLEADSAQWRIWQVADQFFRPRVAATEEPQGAQS